MATREGIDEAMEGGCGFPMGPLRAARPGRARHRAGDPRRAARRVRRPPPRAARRCCAGWSPPGAWGASPAAASTTTVASGPGGPWPSVHALGDADLLGPLERRASNALYRANLAKGQTGLSVAFDLPTQTGYDPDAPEAAGEVGKRRRARRPPRRTCARSSTGIPLAEMNTSMTINATAAVALGALPGARRRAGRRLGAPHGHDPERHRQGVPVAAAPTSSRPGPPSASSST